MKKIRLEYQYIIDRSYWKPIKNGELKEFNGFCKTKEDCIKQGCEVFEKYPEVESIYFHRKFIFLPLRITVHFGKKSLTMFKDEEENIFLYAYSGKLLWSKK